MFHTTNNPDGLSEPVSAQFITEGATVELPSAATQVVAFQRQESEAQEQVIHVSEQIAIASQQLGDATRSVATLGMQHSTMEKLLPRQRPNLLSIPQELRDEVFNYILVQEPSISLYHDLDFQYDPVKQPYLALSSTNKQLRHEAVDMFFKKNKFRWSIIRPLGNVPGRHLRRMTQIDFHSSPNCCCMRIYPKEAESLIYWYGQEWTVTAHGGDIKVHSSHAASWVGQRPYRVLMEFQGLIAQGPGMNVEALKFIGRELRGCGLTR
jgi:hypothetical protein